MNTEQGDGVLSREAFASDCGIITDNPVEMAERLKRLLTHDAALRARLVAAEARIAELEGALRELVDACEPVLDNADGYDISNFRNAIRTSEHHGAWTRDELLNIEAHARKVWKRVRALAGKGENDG